LLKIYDPKPVAIKVPKSTQHKKKASQFFGAAKVKKFSRKTGRKVNLREKIIKSLRD